MGIFPFHNIISKIMDINAKFITINPNHNSIIFLKQISFNLNISNKEKERAGDLPDLEDEDFSLVWR
jgi:hypothetical protein